MSTQSVPGENAEVNSPENVLEAARFLKLLFGGAETGFLSVWCGDTKRSVHYALPTDWAALAERAVAMSQKTDLYFGVGLRSRDLGESARGRAEDVLGVCGPWLDLDIAGPGHAGKSLPRSLEEALAFLDELPLSPSLVVRSGGGLHCYWLFREPWLFESPSEREEAAHLVASWEAYILERARARGWVLDRTSDLARVLRLPGTMNRKASPPVPVRLLRENALRYNVFDFDPYSGGEETRGKRVESEEWARDILEGQRNAELTRRAGSLLAHGIPAGEVLTMLQAWNLEHCKPPLKKNEVQAVVKSIAGREDAKRREETAKIPLTPTTATELLTNDLPPRVDVLGNILPAGGLGLLVAPPKAGKTLLALGLALAVARGEAFLGFTTQARPVLLVSGEGGPQLLRERLAKLTAGDRRDLDRLHLWWPERRTIRLDRGEDRTELIALCRELNVNLLIIDPLVRFHSLDENNTQQMAALVACLAEIRRATGAAVLLLHHIRKQGRDARTGSAQEARGSSVLHGEVDAALVLERRRGSGDFVLYAELRWAPEPAPLLLELDEETLTFTVTGHLEGRERKVPEQMVLRLLREGPATVRQLMVALAVSGGTCRAYLAELKRRGLAAYREGPRKTQVWFATDRPEEEEPPL